MQLSSDTCTVQLFNIVCGISVWIIEKSQVWGNRHWRLQTFKTSVWRRTSTGTWQHHTGAHRAGYLKRTTKTVETSRVWLPREPHQWGPQPTSWPLFARIQSEHWWWTSWEGGHNIPQTCKTGENQEPTWEADKEMHSCMIHRGDGCLQQGGFPLYLPHLTPSEYYFFKEFMAISLYKKNRSLFIYILNVH